jgi:hypothetical protein
MAAFHSWRTLALAGLASIATISCGAAVHPGDGAVNDTATMSSDAATNSDSTTITDATTISDGGEPVSGSITCGMHPTPTYPASITQCTDATQCIAVQHGLDCCGSLAIDGINAAQQDAFNSVEMSCRSEINFNMCGCVAQEAVAQDGHTVGAGVVVRLRCDSGTCVTFVP